MTTFFTADLHLGHENIIRYAGRPFPSADEMDDALVAMWNDIVGAGDDVWVLGDVAMGRIDRSLALVGLMAGTKRLVVGNHDRCFRRGAGTEKDLRDVDRWTARYAQAGFDEIIWGSTTLVLPGIAEPVEACHFPYSGDSQEHERFVDHRPVDHGRVLLHGHVHGSWRRHGRMINVGVDAWAGRPVDTSTLREVVERARHDPDGEEPPLPWSAVGAELAPPGRR